MQPSRSKKKKQKHAQVKREASLDNPFRNHASEASSSAQDKYYSPSQLKQSLREYYGRQLTIQRLFYPDNPIPVEKHYTNLSVLPAENYQQKINAIGGARKKEDIYEYATSLYGHDTGIITPENMVPIVGPQAACKILILGTAGIGKSTLSEYLCYLWAASSAHESPQNQFSRYQWVFRIPVRNLTAERYPPDQSYSVIDIIERECLAPAISQLEPFLSKNNKEKLETLLHQETKGQKVLFIVDGFDELIEDSPDPIVRLMKKLLMLKQVIVTSRPHNLYGLRQNYDFQETIRYEITGFTPPDMKRYIDSFFRFLPGDKADKIDKVLAFLEKNKAMAGACRIPIHLELLCSAWDRQPMVHDNYSVTGIYNHVSDALCRRYLEKKNEPFRHKDAYEIAETCQVPLAFLEHLGYQSVVENRLFIGISKTREYLLRQRPSLKDHPFLEEQHAFGFIRSNMPSGDSDGASHYYFNHLIFRDYFAARFLAHCLQQELKTGESPISYFEHQWPASRGISLIDFLKQRLFDQRYEFIIWFMVGLLAAVRDKQAILCLLSLLKESQDFTEIHRGYLLIRFLDEANEMIEELPSSLWKEVLPLLSLGLKPFFNKWLLDNYQTHPLVERLKISPSFFVNDRVQSFWVKKIHAASLLEVATITRLLCQFKYELPVRVGEALLAKLFQTENSLPDANLQAFDMAAANIGQLCAARCFSDTLFKDFFEQNTGTAEQLASSIIVLFYSYRNHMGELPPNYFNKVRDFFYDLTQPLIVRYAATILFGNARPLCIFLLLKQQNEYYKGLSLKESIQLITPATINIHHAPFIHFLNDQGALNNQGLIEHLHQAGVPLTPIDLFYEIITQSTVTSMEEYAWALCGWLRFLKEPPSASLEQFKRNSLLVQQLVVLKTLENKLLDFATEPYSPLFLKFIGILLPFSSPQSEFNELAIRILNGFAKIFTHVNSPTVRKYMAVCLSLYGDVTLANCAEILNTIIHASFTEVEIAVLAPKIAIISPQTLNFVLDSKFCKKDCTLFLKKLSFDENINIIATSFVLGHTPTEALLNFILKNIHNSALTTGLMGVLILRYMLIGKAIYFNEDGLCYFEHQTYQTYTLTQSQQGIFKNIIQAALSADIFCVLPSQRVKQIEARWNKYPMRSNLVGSSSNEIDAPKIVSKGTTSPPTPPFSILNQYNTYNIQAPLQTNVQATQSALTLGSNSSADYRVESPSNPAVAPPIYAKANPVIQQGDLIMPNTTRLPRYHEYARMSDYAYLDKKASEQEVCKEPLLQAGWEAIDIPSGMCESGYVGAIFRHPVRQQIVVAHAGTLPTRLRTFVADAQGVVGGQPHPLVLDAVLQIMQVHWEERSIHEFIEEGYHLSFTGHSLGGFLAEMSVYACHRGWGVKYPQASAVTFESPGSWEVMQEWESHLAQQQINLSQLNIISFLSSPNIVNTLNSHPGTVYRLIREMPLSTFQSYLLASHDRRALFALFENESGYPLEGQWVEMADWPLADYEELLDLQKHPVSGVADVVVNKAMSFVSRLGKRLYGALGGTDKKVSLTRLFGGDEPRYLWELLEAQTLKDYHLALDTTTASGLRDAIQTHYVIKPSFNPLHCQVALVNISPLAHAFLAFHALHQQSQLYQQFIVDNELSLVLPVYRFDEEHGYLIIEEGEGDIFEVLDVVEAMIAQERDRLQQWGNLYQEYVEGGLVEAQDNIENQRQKLQKIATSNKALINKTQTALTQFEEKQAALQAELAKLKAAQEQMACSKDTNIHNIWAPISAIATASGTTAEVEFTNLRRQDVQDIQSILGMAPIEALSKSERPFIIATGSAIATAPQSTANVRIGGRSSTRQEASSSSSSAFFQPAPEVDPTPTPQTATQLISSQKEELTHPK